ncbi:MAG: hypothetical protein JNM67_00180 [Bacteroidetes bacterium]|nr:hypothetical protein [Bacteroidota bacterium]
MTKHIKYILVISFAWAACSGHTADKALTDKVSHDSSFVTASPLVDELAKFIPTGFELIDEYIEDLNLDSIPDKLILLGLDSASQAKMFPDRAYNEGPADTYIGPRPLIILIRQADNSLKQVARNDHAVIEESATNTGGDAFQGISVNNGEFTIEYFFHGGGGHSTWLVTFKYSPLRKDWLLDNETMVSTSDTPNDEGDYDDTEKEIKTSKDFGQIYFKNYKGNTY